MNRFSLVIAAVIGCFGLNGCGPSKPAKPEAEKIKVGGLYATQDADGKWRVMKVLALDDRAVHLRSYANQFDDKPTDLDPSTLTLGSLDDPAGFGIGHLPMAKEGFFLDSPVLIQVTPVAEEELEGYKLYLEATKRSPKTRK